jgi:hypothetical protein
LVLPLKALLDPMVGEASVYVQGESLKTDAALHVRLINSPVARGAGDVVLEWLDIEMGGGVYVLAVIAVVLLVMAVIHDPQKRRLHVGLLVLSLILVAISSHRLGYRDTMYGLAKEPQAMAMRDLTVYRRDIVNPQ